MEKKTQEISISQIVPSKLNPRKDSDAGKMKELMASIKEKGVLQPIIVRPFRVNDKGDAHFEIVCGERRYHAARAIGLKTMPCVVMELTDDEAVQVAIIENLQREDVGAIQEAQAYQSLFDKALNVKASHPIKDVAFKVGKTEAYIAGRLKLLTLPTKAQTAIEKGDISAAHGDVIGRLQDAKEQIDFLDYILSNKVSVKAAENALRQYGRWLTEATFDTSACKNCEHNGTKQKDMFDKETDLKGRCLNSVCFNEKTAAHFDAQKKELTAQGAKLVTVKDLEKLKVNVNNSVKLTADAKKLLGKAFTEKCAHCESRAFVTERKGYGSDAPLVIVERCLKARCFNTLIRPAPTKAELAEEKENAAEEAKNARDAEKAKAIVEQLITTKGSPIDIIALAITADAFRHNDAFQESVPDAVQVFDLVALDKETLTDLIRRCVERELTAMAENTYLRINHFEPMIKALGIKAVMVKTSKASKKK